MSRLFLAGNWISNTQFFGHLQVVYSVNGHDFLEAEAQFGIPDFTFVPIRDHFDPANTQGVGSEDTYRIAEVKLIDGQDVDGAWNLIVQVNNQLANAYQSLDYGLLQNSNSYATTLFSVVGVDTLDYLAQVTPNFVTHGFPAAQRNILENAIGVSIASLDLVGGDGNDFIRTGAGDDDLAGGDGSDTLIGRSGEDELYGGAGDDFLFFDAADGPNVNGGAGHDAAWLIGDDAVSFDMTANEIEVLVGGGGNDTLTAGSASDTVMIAGGAGADVFDVSYGSGEGTRILWGGEGADTFDFIHTGDYSPEAYQLGILVASVSGLTAANFAMFTLSMLGLPASFNWGKIDAVILNPDAVDRISLEGQTINTSSYTEELWSLTGFDEDGFGVYGQVAAFECETAITGTSDVLGPSMQIQSPERDIIETQWFRDYESPHTALWGGMETGQETVDWARDTMMALYGPPAVTWTVDCSNAQGAQAGGNGEGWVGRLAAGSDGDYTPDSTDSWFVAGGRFEGDVLFANNAVTANMDGIAGIPTDWLLS